MAGRESPLPVRGTCKRGHVLDTVAEGRKLTWRGPCPAQWGNGNCGLYLVAHRIEDAGAAGEGGTGTGVQSQQPPANEPGTQPQQQPGQQPRRQRLTEQ